MRGLRGFLFPLAVCLLPVAVQAKDISFEISVDRSTTGLDQAVVLNLSFDGTQSIPAPELPAIEGFHARYLGPSTRMSVINGQVSSSITHMYTLLPTKKGTFKIGPLSFQHNGDKYHSNQITVEVVDAPRQERFAGEEATRADDTDLSERIFMIIQSKKSAAYLNEIVPVKVKLYVNRLGVRDIQYPRLVHEGVSIGEFGQPKQYQELVGGVNYQVIEFETEIFGLRPGEFRLGPADLQCNLLVKKQPNRRMSSLFDDFFSSDVFDDFFGRYETYPYKVKSTDIPLRILPLPEENKPVSFSGAIGDFDFEASVSPAEVKVGDPVTLKSTIRGEGNFGTVNLPVISSSDFKIYEPQVKQEQGAKIFEQVLIPLRSTITEIPALQFSFFNTRTGKYETVIRGPFPLKVAENGREDRFTIVENKPPAVAGGSSEELGKDIVYIKSEPGKSRKRGQYLHKNRLFLAAQFFPLAVYLLIAIVFLRNKRLKTDSRYARKLIAPRKARAGINQAKKLLEKGNQNEFYDCLFGTLQEYLGDRFHLPSRSITVDMIEESLKDKAVPDAVMAKLREIFSRCDMVRYASGQLDKQETADCLKKLEEIIDYFQRSKI